jgi:hypothetical protein
VYFDYHEQERTTMQSRIRIMKGGIGANRNSLAANQSEKTDGQLDREMANTVKSWVAEWEARNRALKAAAASLIRSLEDGRPVPAPQFGVNQ